MVWGNKRNSAFSLVELSIVLVIISFLIAAVVAGNYVVEQAKLRKFMTQIQDYKASVNLFKTRYKALPGDMAKATDFWSTTINGDGSGRILHTAYPCSECTMAWSHLDLADLINDSFSGTVGTAEILGVNVPKGPYLNSGFRIFDTGMGPYGVTGNRISFEAMISAASGLGAGILDAASSYSVDRKIDDGLADSGILYATTGDGVGGSATECTTGDWVDATSSYNLGVTDKLCRLMFWIDKR